MLASHALAVHSCAPQMHDGQVKGSVHSQQTQHLQAQTVTSLVPTLGGDIKDHARQLVCCSSWAAMGSGPREPVIW